MNLKVRLGRPAMLALMLMVAWNLTVPVEANPPSGPWLTDLSEAFNTAKEQNKPVLVMFSAAWCQPCNEMKNEVFTQPSVQQALSAWVPVYVDEAQSPDLVKRFKIEGYPSFVLLSNKGVEEDRFMGARSADDFLHRLSSILDTNKELQDVNRQISDDPQNAALWKKKGDLLTRIDMLDQGLAAYQKAESMDPDNKTGVAADIYYFDTLKMDAKDPVTMKDIDRRLSQIGQLYPNSPRVSDALFMRALLALNQKNMIKAKRSLQTYLTNYPSGRFATPARQMLQSLNAQSQQGQGTNGGASGMAPGVSAPVNPYPSSPMTAPSDEGDMPN